jgi:hypothetical protein
MTSIKAPFGSIRAGKAGSIIKASRPEKYFSYKVSSGMLAKSIVLGGETVAELHAAAGVAGQIVETT